MRKRYNGVKQVVGDMHTAYYGGLTDRSEQINCEPSKVACMLPYTNTVKNNWLYSKRSKPFSLGQRPVMSFIIFKQLLHENFPNKLFFPKPDSRSPQELWHFYNWTSEEKKTIHTSTSLLLLTRSTTNEQFNASKFLHTKRFTCSVV